MLPFDFVGKGRQFAQVRLLVQQVHHIGSSDQRHVVRQPSIVLERRHTVFEAEAALGRQIQHSALTNLVTMPISPRRNAHGHVQRNEGLAGVAGPHEHTRAFKRQPLLDQVVLLRDVPGLTRCNDVFGAEQSCPALAVSSAQCPVAIGLAGP